MQYRGDAAETAESIGRLNAEQRAVFDFVRASVVERSGKFVFVDAPGGTGKTFLINTLIKALCGEGKKVVSAASSGVASLLLIGGRTLHASFWIGKKVDATTVCKIERGTARARMVRELDFIVWDEAPMFSKALLECLDKSLRDIRETPNKPFGGVTILLSGDWRQILPVVRNGGRPEIVGEIHKRSSLWRLVTKFELRTNMRVVGNGPAEERFKQFLLSVGDGSANNANVGGDEKQVVLPNSMVVEGHQMSTLIDEVFPAIDVQIREPHFNDWI